MGNKWANKAAEKSNEDNIIRILCFGDSLTAGYLNGGAIHIPYSNTLQQLIEKEYKQSFKAQVIESGVDGEKLTFIMLTRLTSVMKHISFDFVIFLGGTNDVGTAQKAQKICEELGKIYNVITVQNKAKCIALTIPPYGAVLDQHNNGPFGDTRAEVNGFIKAQVEKSNNHQMTLCDLYEHIHSLDDESKQKFFDKDGLHFSEYGYTQMGQLVFKTMVPLLDEMKRNHL